MNSILQAYTAVHSTDVKEELDSSRDPISEMILTQLTDNDLCEVAEEILEGLFIGGSSVAQSQQIMESVLIESDIPGRQQKIDRLQEAFSSVIGKVKEKSARTAIESFAEYRKAKSVNEAWINKFDHDKGRVRLHDSLIAKDRLVIKTGLLQMIEKAKSPAAEEEKLRKDDDLFGSPNDEGWKPYKKKKVKTEDKKWGYDSKGKSLNPADQEEEEREDDELFGSPNAKKKGKKKVKKEEVELAEKQKDTPDQVKAVIAFDKARKGTRDATYDSMHGKKKQAKKERDYAKWQRDKGAEDAQKSGHPWEHAKGSTREKEGKKSETHAYIKDSYAAEGVVSKELKDLSKAGKTLKGKDVAKADKVDTPNYKGYKFGVKEAKDWIQGAVKRPGAFTRKAKAAGMSVQQFAKHVDANKSKYSTRTERQANLAQTFASMKKEDIEEMIFNYIAESHENS